MQSTIYNNKNDILCKNPFHSPTENQNNLSCIIS